jgi:hypothetical protein
MNDAIIFILKGKEVNLKTNIKLRVKHSVVMYGDARVSEIYSNKTAAAI